nr:damage-inducible type I toxin DinQ [Serratia fonticola]
MLWRKRVIDIDKAIIVLGALIALLELIRYVPVTELITET